jgi:hypothetical protein
MEAVLPAAAAAAQARGELPASIDLATYVRQYRGYRKSGVLFIDTLLFCSAARHLADKDTIVSGGGDCLIEVIYDTATAEFHHWRTRPRR